MLITCCVLVHFHIWDPDSKPKLKLGHGKKQHVMIGQVANILTGDSIVSCTNHTQLGMSERVLYGGAKMRVCWVFWATNFVAQNTHQTPPKLNKGFGHGAGLGADRQQQQQVTGGNYPKAKHVPPPTKMYIFIQKQCLLFRQVSSLAGIFVAAL